MKNVRFSSHPLSMLKTITGLIILLAISVISAACSGTSAGDLAVGNSAPDFSLSTSDGDQVSLNDFVGDRPTLLYFHMAMG